MERSLRGMESRLQPVRLTCVAKRSSFSQLLDHRCFHRLKPGLHTPEALSCRNAVAMPRRPVYRHHEKLVAASHSLNNLLRMNRLKLGCGALAISVAVLGLPGRAAGAE